MLLLLLSSLAGFVAADPLLLTPLILNGQLKEAREKSQISQKGDADFGYAGYFTVQAQHTDNLNNMYFWYQPCTDCSDDSKLLIWIQGGPGGPGTFGAMAEIGNFYIDEKVNPQERCYSWCLHNHCLFVDSPVMTGFSYQVDPSGKPIDNLKDIDFTDTSASAMSQVHNMATQFYQIFPELSDVGVVVTGESYGGFYTPHLGLILANDPKVNLVGLAVGDPVINWPYQMPTYPSTLYGMGLIMTDERANLQKIFSNSLDRLAKGDCQGCFDAWNSVWDDNAGFNTGGFYAEYTGNTNTANGLMGGPPTQWGKIDLFFAEESVQNAFHFSGYPAPLDGIGPAIYDAFVTSGDWCRNSSDLFAELIAKTDIDLMIYSSTADPLLGPPTTEAGVMAILDDLASTYTGGNLIRGLFHKQTKDVWRVDSANDQQVAGAAKCISTAGVFGQLDGSGSNKRFCYAVIHNAGHESPGYQPRSSYDLITRFLDGRSFDKTGDSPKDLPKCLACSGVGPFGGDTIPACQNPAGY